MTEITPPLDGYTIYDPIDPLENHVGPFFWKELEEGIQHFVLKAETRHCNRHEIVHGGLMMTMIDLAMVVAAKETWDEQLVTVSLNSEFVDAGRAGDLIEANGELVRRTGSMAFVRGRVYAGERTLLSSSAVLKRMRVKTTER
ncbi:MAG: PaaI family thioesterase [Pseudomonadota bacterium]|nr:PaaI family thioesterase [Pseudomonadota bacterium]